MKNLKLFFILFILSSLYVKAASVQFDFLWKKKVADFDVYTFYLENFFIYLPKDNFITAFDLKNDRSQWEMNVESPVFGAIKTIKDVTFFLGQEKFYSICLPDKTIKWNQKGHFGYPLIVDNIYIGERSSKIFYCLDYEGKELWKKDLGLEVFPSPVVFKNTIIICASDSSFLGKYGIVYAFDMKSGEKKWKYKVKKSAINSEPITQDNQIYIGCDNGELLVLNAEKGKCLWKFRPENTFNNPSNFIEALVNAPPLLSPIRVCNNILSMSIGSRLILGLDLNSKAVKWEKVYDKKNHITTVAYFLNDKLFFGTKDGYLHILNAATGEEIWKFQADSPIYAQPIIENNMFYFLSEKGILYAFKCSF